MLKTLIKKQFFECFRTYFVNAKTSRSRSKSGIVGMFVLFTVLMVFLCAIFFGVAFLLGDTLVKTELVWIYFSLMGIVSIAFGTFGSVFNTYASLYLSKDNEMLLSMPIKSSSIITSRIILVYGLSLLYSGIVWIPTLIFYWFFGNPSVTAVIFGFLLIFIIALFVTVLTCVLGWVVALISSRLKRKNLIVVILSLAFFLGYYYICFKMTDFLGTIIKNIVLIGESVKSWGNIFYQLGNAACGKVLPMLVFSGISVVLFAVCFYVLSKSFTKIVTKAPDVKLSKAKKIKTRQNSVERSLFNRELKRFLGSSTYMLNCGLGILFLPIIAVIVIVKRGTVKMLVDELSALIPNVESYVPLVIVSSVCLIVSMNVISTPSVSLEGKNLWVLKSLPVTTRQIFDSKRKLHFWPNVLPAVLTTVVLDLCIVKMNIVDILLTVAYVVMFVYFTADIGLFFGISRVNLNWTNEAMVIKQSINVLLSILAGWVITALSVVGFYFLDKYLSIQAYLAIWIVLFSGGIYGLEHWLKTKGTKIFNTL